MRFPPGVKFSSSLAIVLWVATAAMGRTAPSAGEPGWTNRPNPRPHPAVVRVIAADRNGASFGSGALVAVSGEHGLVVTNWHVVRDAAGPITVVFPDGFRSGATVLKTDRDWDLAALAIWRPRVEPIRLSTQPPRPGETLTIAGYGRGSYRAATGRCTQYVSPGGNQPFEMVELAAAARDGDSGGPILNHRGELAGVLFGAAKGRTTGSYCGRVGWFLGSISDEFRDPPQSSTMIARRPAPPPDPPAEAVRPDPLPIAAIPAGGSTAAEAARSPQSPSPPESGWVASPPPPESGWTASPPPSGTQIQAVGPEAGEPAGADEPGRASRSDQIKTILAVIGAVALLFHGLRLLGSLQGA